VIALPITPTLAFRDSFDIYVIDGEAAIIRSDREEHLLHGALHARLTPLLDGRHSLDAIIDTLQAQHSPEEVYYAIDRLRSKGWITDWGAATDTADTAATVSAVPEDLIPQDASRDVVAQDASHHLIAQDAISLRTCAAHDADAWRTALSAAGLSIAAAEGTELTLFVTRDYLDPAIDEWNRLAHARSQRWLLAGQGRGLTWIGPLFVPGRTACWACAGHRLRRNRAIDPFLQQRARRIDARAPRRHAVAADPNAIALIARYAASALSGDGLHDVILRFDPIDGHATRHAVLRRPQCPVCGDPATYARHAVAPVRLRSCSADRADGGLRTVPASNTLTRLSALVDPVTGIVPELRRSSAQQAPSPVYVAGVNAARPWKTLAGLRRGLRSHSSGKGLSDDQARASALAESVERYCGIWQGDEPRVEASFESLGTAALDPDACQLFSARQLATRSRAGAEDPRDRLPAAFDAGAIIDWSPVWSLTRHSHRYLPTALLYYDAPDPGNFFVADSNGAAAGNTIEEAVLQGLLELVERDAAGIWWYSRSPRPFVDVADMHDDRFDTFAEALRAAGREIWLLDLTTDLGIPVFAAVSRQVGQLTEAPILGLGCHLDEGIAAGRALSELGQMLAAASSARPDLDGALTEWLSGATVADHPYIGRHAPRNADSRHAPAGHRTDLLASIEVCLRRLERADLEVFVLDQTRPDIDFSVMKVIVPGLRHIRPRFAPGRLFTVPMREGWTTRPLLETQLNPVPFFL
jgi:oxazoline/thiazoline synthase